MVYDITTRSERGMVENIIISIRTRFVKHAWQLYYYIIWYIIICTYKYIYMQYIITYIREKTNFVRKNSSKINRFMLLPTGRFHVNRRRLATQISFLLKFFLFEMFFF